VTLQRARRALRKPPHVLARRLLQEAHVELERVRAPLRARTVRVSADDGRWERAVERAPRFDVAPPTDVLARAEAALGRRVDLLGSGPLTLGRPIDWERDPRTGTRWERGYAPRLAYVRPPADVKLPWEISRVQWLLPAAQAYEQTGDERYAAGVRDVLDEWIAANPYAQTVNWSVTMEVALRILSWSWLLGALGGSDAWRDASFRRRFLTVLWLHGDYTRRHLERSDVNGNHFTADAAGLVFAGLVFDERRWIETGWTLLLEELPRQVTADGVDFEASAAYHRLVGELFLLPALYRGQHGLPVPPWYRERLDAMGRFTLAITGPDGLAPLWGDSDDARALPLDGRPPRDQRGFPELLGVGRGPRAFPDGGVYVLARGDDHVFVDCGPVGLAGRGGHGHNDCLSFEAVLAGQRLITDCGSYVYTSDPEQRNAFRATAAHNTPRVDAVELNRIPASLWALDDDARPEALLVEELSFRGSHTGYLRLPDPVRPVRTIELDPARHALLVHDEFEAAGPHEIEIPYHVQPGLIVARGEDTVALGRFVLRWEGEWRCDVEEAFVSPSYGVKLETRRIVFRRSGRVAPLRVTIAPA
jgi:Heparinase II/III-like protein/Heparinase II/III N-terminus